MKGLTKAALIAEIRQTKIDTNDFLKIFYTGSKITAGTYDDWTYKDTAGHILEWVAYSDGKLRKIAAKETFNTSEDADFDLNAINISVFEKNRDFEEEVIFRSLSETFDSYAETVGLFSESDLSRTDFPTGFSWELRKYMLLDTVIHPVMHFAFCALKHKKYDFFINLLENRRAVFAAFSCGKNTSYSFAEYIENPETFAQNFAELRARNENSSLIQTIHSVNSSIS